MGFWVLEFITAIKNNVNYRERLLKTSSISLFLVYETGVLFMRALLNEKSVEKFNTKVLYKEVIGLFDEYNINQLTIQDIAEESLGRKLEVREECFQHTKSDPTWKATLKSDKLVDSVIKFENKIKYLKTQFTDDEAIIFHYSLEERELDKEIMDRVCKFDHKYYQIKKSCYLKVALSFGLIKPKQQKLKAVSMVAPLCE